MADPTAKAGLAELKTARRKARVALVSAFLFSIFINLLLLTSPLYMLQVYDRVLVSRSEATLLALSLLAMFLFVIMGVLDHVRSRVMTRIGLRLVTLLDGRALSAAFRRLAIAPRETVALTAQQDLDALARLWASPVLTALMDLPWTPLFAAALFIFHPLMGWFAIGGAVTLILVTWLNQVTTEAPLNEATLTAQAADRQADNLKSESELIRALGMSGHAFARWHALRAKAQEMSLFASDRTGRFAILTKTFRLFLQSAILGLGAWLVLRQEMSAGAMIAGSILMGRALQPIELAIGQWAIITRARQANERLSRLLTDVPAELPRTPLPRPQARLDVQGLAVVAPGETLPLLRGVSFRLDPGQAMGVIGLSGSGKSTLARALIGVWRPMAGHIRLDGATLDQFDPDVLGSFIGYLPQRVALFDGTIAENIARLDTRADPSRIVEAAKKAAVHDMILRLPKGYDTPVSTMGGRLSGGQIQRIGLARAFYGRPVMLVLDEPNSNLDNDGSTALNQAIRAAKADGSVVLIMAHRPAAIQECEFLMVMKDGTVQTQGPREQVLREAVKNAGDIARSIAPGGVA